MKYTHTSIRAAIPAILGLVLVCGGCRNTSSSQPTDIDTQAKEVMEALSRSFAESDTLSYSVVESIDIPDVEGRLVEHQGIWKVRFSRSGALALDWTFDGRHLIFTYVNSEVTLYDPEQNDVLRKHVEGTLDEVLNYLKSEHDWGPPGVDLLYADLSDGLLSEVTKGEYLGQHTIDGQNNHHLMFTQDLIDWEIWVSSAEPALPQRLLIVYKAEPNAPRYQATFSECKLNEDGAEAITPIEIPADATPASFEDIVYREKN